MTAPAPAPSLESLFHHPGPDCVMVDGKDAHPLCVVLREVAALKAEIANGWGRAKDLEATIAALKELIKGYELREGIILGHRDTAREEAEEAITEKYREQEKYEKEKARTEALEAALRLRGEALNVAVDDMNACNQDHNPAAKRILEILERAALAKKEG